MNGVRVRGTVVAVDREGRVKDIDGVDVSLLSGIAVVSVGSVSAGLLTGLAPGMWWLAGVALGGVAGVVTALGLFRGAVPVATQVGGDLAHAFGVAGRHLPRRQRRAVRARVRELDAGMRDVQAELNRVRSMVSVAAHQEWNSPVVVAELQSRSDELVGLLTELTVDAQQLTRRLWEFSTWVRPGVKRSLHEDEVGELAEVLSGSRRLIARHRAGDSFAL